MEIGADKIFENCILFDDNLSDLPSSAGFVLLADSQNKPIALLTTANIKRTAKTKLAEKIDPSTGLRAGATKKADLKSITAKIYYTVCPCKFRLAVKYLDAARKVFGQNYKEHIKLVLPWFVRIDLGGKIPVFSITKRPMFKTAEEILGHFASQKTATVFLKALEDAFRLCKRSDLVNSSEAAKSCPYIQMDACCGVCGGKVSIEDYKNTIKDAFEAGANPKAAIEELKGQMQKASADLSFERAAQLKKRIEKISILTKQPYRWTSDLEKLKIIHIDKSFKVKPEGAKKKVQSYAVFVIDFFNINDLGDFAGDNIDSIYEATSKNISNSPQKISDEVIERFSIVSYFLYRSKPSGLWLNAGEGIDKDEFLRLLVNILDSIRTR